MITRTITLNEINDFIIAELENIFVEKTFEKKLFKKKLFKKSLNKNEINEKVFNYSKKHQKFGIVQFRKNKNDSHIKIHFIGCRYGFDFYNNDQSTETTETTDECCVCYEKTQEVIHCGHKICGSCVTEIMNHSKTINCPMCRKNHEINEGLKINYPMHLVTLLFN